MRNGANFSIIADEPHRLMIRDKGPWDQHPTITNGAEEVVQRCFLYHELKDRKLLYEDSEGELSELLHDGNGKFKGFAP
jgi:hypothetical protein